MTKEKYKEALLYMSISDMITIYNLKDKNILFLFKNDEDKSNFNLNMLVESQGDKFIDIDLKSVEKGIISDIITYLKELKIFDCIFVMKLGRMLNKTEIMDLMLTLSERGSIFHIDDCGLDKSGFENQVFSDINYISNQEEIYYWILKFFMNPTVQHEYDAFFENPDWHNRTGAQIGVDLETITKDDVNRE